MLVIKDIIKNKGISVSNLAADLGMEQSNLSAIINEKRGVSLKKLKEIADALDVHVLDLFKDGRNKAVSSCPNCGHPLKIRLEK